MFDVDDVGCEFLFDVTFLSRWSLHLLSTAPSEWMLDPAIRRDPSRAVLEPQRDTKF